MRRSLIAAALAVALAGLVACGGSGTEGDVNDAPNGFGTKTVEAGAVTVKIEPKRLDAGGAEFKVSFDTHSVALDLDVARSAGLTVGATPWSEAAWSGDGPGGHHREGTLRFSASGPAQGAATLTISGLPAPVTATWPLGG